MINEKKYNKFVESVEISKIELLVLNCYQNDDFAPKKNSNIDVAVSSEVKEVKHKGLELDVHFSFEVIAFSNDDGEKKKELKREDIQPEDVLFQIEFVLKLRYSLMLEDVKDIMIGLEKEIDLFVERNVPVNAWPYAREIISSISTRMGFPALVIPSFKNIPLN